MALTHVVRLVDVPIADYVHLEAQHNALLRELSLVAMDGEGSTPPSIHRLAVGLADTLGTLRRVVTPAITALADAGHASGEVDLEVSDDDVADLERLNTLLRRADELSRQGGLLTTPTPAQLVALREWLFGEVSGQTRGGAAPSRLRTSDDRFLRLLERLDGVVWEVEAPTLRPLFISGAAAELLGLPLATLASQVGPWAELIEPEDRSAVLAWRRSAVAGEATGSLDYRIAVDGGVRWLRDRISIAPEPGAGTRLLGLTVDVTDEQVAARRRDARALIAQSLATGTSLEAVAAAVLSAACEGGGWDVGVLWLADGRGELRAERVWSTGDPALEPFVAATRDSTFPPGVGLPGRVLVSGQPAWVDEVRTDPNFPRAAVAQASGLRSAVSLPIVTRGAVVGVLEFDSRHRREADRRALEDLSAIATQIGLFVERRRAEDDLLFQKALLESESEAALDAIVVVSDEGRVLSHNQRFAEMSGIDPGVLARGDAQPVLDFGLRTLVDPGAFMTLVQQVRDDHQPRRIELRLHDGRIVDCYVASLPVPAIGGGARAWYFRDITDRKRDEEELKRLAQTLQNSLLPPVAPRIPGLDVATRYRYAFAGDEVGGDFYDVFQIGTSWGAVIGDVCGKGAGAASLTALARYTARGAAMGDTAPGEVLAVVNDAVMADPDESRLCTLAYVQVELNDHSLSVRSAAAGHPLPLVVRRDGRVEALGRPGTLLGAFTAIEVFDASATLQSGDALVLHTDGVTEARRGKEFFGGDRLEQLLTANAGEPADTIVNAVVEAVLDFQLGVPRDDIAVVTIRVP